MVESYIRNIIAKDITILNGVNHGGQTNLQAATKALAPYAAELIGKQFGHGNNQNQAAQLVAHALLGAISASVNGSNAAAGAVAQAQRNWQRNT